MLPLATWCCDVFGVFEIPEEEVEDPWCLHIGPKEMLDAEVMSYLRRAVNVSCPYTGFSANHSDFVYWSKGKICELDTLFVVPWDAWKKQIFTCAPIDLQVAPADDEDGAAENDLAD